jgi:hypothetical protein
VLLQLPENILEQALGGVSRIARGASLLGAGVLPAHLGTQGPAREFVSH